MTKIKRSAVKSIGFDDVFKTGHDQLIKRNLIITRHRMKLRRQRKFAFKEAVYQIHIGSGNESSTSSNNSIEEGFLRLHQT